MYGLSAKKMAVIERWQLWRGGCCRQVAVEEVAIVERWPLWRGGNKSECMDCPSKKWPLCREVAISEGSTALVNGKITVFLSKKHASQAVYQT